MAPYGPLWPLFHRRRSRVPAPHVVSFRSGTTLADVEEKLLQPRTHAEPRLVLDFDPPDELSADGSARPRVRPARQQVEQQLKDWAQDSVGRYRRFREELRDYGAAPHLSKGRDLGPVQNMSLAYQVVLLIRPCMKIFDRIRGNRSCFDKCD